MFIYLSGKWKIVFVKFNIKTYIFFKEINEQTAVNYKLECLALQIFFMHMINIQIICILFTLLYFKNKLIIRKYLK